MEKKDILIKKFGIIQENLIEYPNQIFKINHRFEKNNCKEKKLILLTAISPTKHGEGKTTCSIGLADAMNFLGEKTVLALREPSMGPVFGSKGTATGGGNCVIEPSDEINLHFTGDFHAISSANNLISAAIDSHIYWGNKLSIDLSSINWERCLDVNDRSLREVEISIKKDLKRKESFVITSASKMMTTLSLCSDQDDLRKRLENTIFAFDNLSKPLYLKDLNVVGSVMAILKNALLPNIVFTKHKTPAFVHCGPFANIATGTNSVLSIKTALDLSDYVVTEAGFSSELGFEKFSNVVATKNDLKPNCVVLVATIRALKEKGDFENNFCSLEKHINNIKISTSNFIIVINKFKDDLDSDILFLKTWLLKNNCEFAVNESYSIGPEGAIEFAKKVIAKSKNICDFESKVDKLNNLEEKIKFIVENYYHCKNMEYSKDALKDICFIKENFNDFYKNWPVVIAKSQNSIDGNDEQKSNYVLTIRGIKLNTSAKFILVLTNKIFMMPGLPKNPNYKEIDLLNSKIVNMK